MLVYHGFIMVSFRTNTVCHHIVLSDMLLITMWYRQDRRWVRTTLPGAWTLYTCTHVQHPTLWVGMLSFTA